MGSLGAGLRVLEGLAAVATITDAGLKVAPILRTALKDRRDPPWTAERRRLLDLLGLSPGSRVSYRLSTNHPVGHRSLSGNELATIEAVIDPRFTPGPGRPWLVAQREPVTTVDISQNLVLVGSPESEDLTRLVFGYEDLGECGVRFSGGTIPLRYRWKEDVADDPNLPWCLQNLPNRALRLRRNWPLVYDDGNGRVLSSHPSDVLDSFLKEDYVIITRIPNFLTERALQSGRSITSIGGLHSVGTRAFERALNDTELVADLTARILSLPPPSRALQVVLVARQVVHDPLRGSFPTAVQIHDVVELELNDKLLTDARSVVAGRIAAWRDSTEKHRDSALLGHDFKPPFNDRDFAILQALQPDAVGALGPPPRP